MLITVIMIITMVYHVHDNTTNDKQQRITDRSISGVCLATLHRICFSSTAPQVSYSRVSVRSRQNCHDASWGYAREPESEPGRVSAPQILRRGELSLWGTRAAARTPQGYDMIQCTMT